MHRKIRIALTISLLWIGKTGVPNRLAIDNLFLSERQRPQRFREKLEALRPDSRLACTRAKQRAGHADDVAEIEMIEHAEFLVAELILSEVQLNAPGGISKMREHRLPVRAPRDDSASHCDLRSFG